MATPEDHVKRSADALELGIGLRREPRRSGRVIPQRRRRSLVLTERRVRGVRKLLFGFPVVDYSSFGDPGAIGSSSRLH